MMEMKRVNAYTIKLFALPRSTSRSFSFLKTNIDGKVNVDVIFGVTFMFYRTAISFWYQRLTNQDEIELYFVCYFSNSIEMLRSSG